MGDWIDIHILFVKKTIFMDVFKSEELQHIEKELQRLGLQRTLDCFRAETRSRRPSRSDLPENSTRSPPRMGTSFSESSLAPLTVTQPVQSEPTLLFKTRSADYTGVKSPGRSRRPSPHYKVVPVHDQLKFKATEISNKAFSEKSNEEEYPVTPLSFSARSSTSKESALGDPPSATPRQIGSPFTWDISEKDASNVTLAPPLIRQQGPSSPIDLKNETSVEESAEKTQTLMDCPMLIKEDSLSRVDSLNESLNEYSDLSKGIERFVRAEAFTTLLLSMKVDSMADPVDDNDDNGTVASLPESDTSPFAEFVFTPPEPPQDVCASSNEDPKNFSFPQTPQGSDAESGGALNVLRSFNSTRSNDILSSGNSSKTAKSPFQFELSSSMSSKRDVSSSGDLGSPGDVPTSLPMIFNLGTTQKRVSLSLNNCGYDLEAILTNIQRSTTQGNVPLDTFPEELWMNKSTRKDSKSEEYLLPRYTFSQKYIDDTYDLIDLKIFHKKGKTGFESNKDLYVEMGDIIAGRYQVIKVVGSAVFSKAIKALDLKLNRPVCLKMVKNVKDYFDQSLDEIKLLRLLNGLDPNDEHGVVRLLDFFYYREHLFLVFELLKENLYEIQQKSIKEHGSVRSASYYFTAPRIKSIARQILITLRFLHSRSIIHSDLKPENVLIKDTEETTVKVIDLGSSCFVTDFLGSYIQSRSYRAPEVVLGVDYDQKIDIWSLGCMVAELYTGSVLFQSTSLAELLVKVESVRGPLPTWMLYQGKFSAKYYSTSMKIFRKNPITKEYEILHPVSSGLQEILKNADGAFVDFVSLLLITDPHKRPSAEAMLKHRWLEN